MSPENPSTPHTQFSGIPTSGPLIGIDYGSKRIGLAVSTPERNLCFPIEIIQRKSVVHDFESIRKACLDYRVLGLVMGLAIHMSGDEGEQAGLARSFGEELSQFCKLPIAYVDERFSSLTADTLLYKQQLTSRKHQSRRDAVAAQVLLQTYIDHGSLDTYCPRYD